MLFNRMHITCCDGCVPPKRSIICHGICPEYKAQRAALDASNGHVRKQKEDNNEVMSFSIDRMARQGKIKKMKKT